MLKHMKWQFWLEAVIALITGLMFLVTLFWNDWIELVFHVDPDSNNGSLEWGIMIALALMTIAFIILARIEWSKAKVALS